MNKPLINKIALITGGSRGIGRATALSLAEAGANVIINYVRNTEAAENTVNEIKKIGGKSISIKADIGEHEDIKEMFRIIKNEFGRLDILINNAAFGGLGPFMRMGRLVWDKTMHLNTGGVLLCSQRAVNLMDNGGKIINLSSLGSHRYLPDYVAIGTAKAAIETMTKYMAFELAEKGIIVNTVSAGFVDTDALKVFKNIEELKSESVKRTPAKRIGKPEDVAKVVLFLCTEQSDWIVGQTIIADGGASLI